MSIAILYFISIRKSYCFTQFTPIIHVHTRIRCDEVSSIECQKSKPIDRVASHFIILVLECCHKHWEEMLHKRNNGVAHSKHHLHDNMYGFILAACVLQDYLSPCQKHVRVCYSNWAHSMGVSQQFAHSQLRVYIWSNKQTNKQANKTATYFWDSSNSKWFIGDWAGFSLRGKTTMFIHSVDL